MQSKITGYTSTPTIKEPVKLHKIKRPTYFTKITDPRDGMISGSGPGLLEDWVSWWFPKSAHETRVVSPHLFLFPLGHSNLLSWKLWVVDNVHVKPKGLVFCFQAATTMWQSYSDQLQCYVPLTQTVGLSTPFLVIQMKLEESGIFIALTRPITLTPSVRNYFR